MLDPTFGQGGKLALGDDGGGDGSALALVRQPDGKNVVAGSDGRHAVVHRLNPDGMLDPTFGQSGRVGIDDGGPNVAYTAALQPDGKILVAGAGVSGDNTDAVVYRLDRDGSLDPGFDGDGALRIDGGGGEAADALAVQPDGKVLVGGLSITGLTQTAVIYRLQGGDPAPRAQGSTQAGAVTSPRRAPVLGLRISPPAFRAVGRGPSVLPATRSGGALVAFTVDQAANVRFVVERAASGRRVGGRCVKPMRSNRGRRPCTRYTKLAAGFTRQGVAGANRLRFTGRLSGRRLRPAGYRLVATPSADGRRGAAKRTRFRITG
jgi:uncharacterized delta-60 repeat protein